MPDQLGTSDREELAGLFDLGGTGRWASRRAGP